MLVVQNFKLVFSESLFVLWLKCNLGILLLEINCENFYFTLLFHGAPTTMLLARRIKI